MIRCPRCFDALRPVPLNKGAVYRCAHCSGVFTPMEECAELLGPLVDVETWRQTDWATFLGPSRLKSPRSGQAMERVQLAWAGEIVEIDMCTRTGGLWFDAGEMKAVSEITHEVAQDKDGDFSHLHQEMGLRSYLFQLLFTLPLELCNPVRRKPVVTHALIVLCCMAFAWQVSTEDIESSTRTFALVPELMEGKQLWGAITYIFMHGGLLHLVGNMLMLYVFGDNIEDIFGRIRYLLFFLICGVSGAFLQVFMQSGSLMVVGASGAIAGVLGAYLVLFPRVKVRMVVLFVPFFIQVRYYLIFWIASNFFGLMNQDGAVALYCHIGGFLCGLLLAIPYRNYDIQENLES